MVRCKKRQWLSVRKCYELDIMREREREGEREREKERERAKEREREKEKVSERGELEAIVKEFDSEVIKGRTRKKLLGRVIKEIGSKLVIKEKDLVYLTAYQPLMGYLRLKFNSFINALL